MIEEALAVEKKVLDFPMCVLPAETFVALGRMHSHESVRAHLQYLDTAESLADKTHPILFFSHEWVSPEHPDPRNEQYPLMVEALGVIVRANGWFLSDVRVWLVSAHAHTHCIMRARRARARNALLILRAGRTSPCSETRRTTTRCRSRTNAASGWPSTPSSLMHPSPMPSARAHRTCSAERRGRL